MFASVSNIHSNPATVAAMIRINGLDAVRRSRLVRPDVLREVRRSVMRGEYCEYRKLLCARRISPRFIAKMSFAKAHGPESLYAADRRPFGARLVAAFLDVWTEGLDHGAAGCRHGWDVGLRIKGMGRQEIYLKALSMGMDLEAAPLPASPDFADAEILPAARRMRRAQRIMQRTCKLFGVTPEDLRGPRRDRVMAVPRHFYIFWMKQLGSFSFPEIGKKLGERDHTTVLNSFNKWPLCRDEARRLIEARRLTVRHAGRGKR